MAALPTGTVTFLFTDVEGSTRLLHDLGDRYAEVLGRHRRTLRQAFARYGGVEVDAHGDAFFVAFAHASDALAAAAEGRDALAAGPVRVRMGLHTGEPLLTEEGYVGIDVHRAARIAAAAHGGQIVLSQATYGRLGGPAELRDLGLHRLKDLTQPERLYQLGRDEFPPLRTLNASNLPIQPTPLVDREAEVTDAVRELRTGTRVLTLTGAGGTGKTRLALQVAAELVSAFVDGVFWIPLAAISDSSQVAPAIARALGVREGDTPIAEALTNHLRGRRLLLLLDNLEHLVAAAPQLAELLRECPDLFVLATSRAPLRLTGEREHEVPPLLTEHAVELFVQRATAVDRSFRPHQTVAEICRQLDGLPLAIELAAARIRLLRPEELLERLERRLPILTGGARDLPARQQTLWATIDWSHQLLEPSEQELFARLSVFAGGWTLEAAGEVCDARLDTLSHLVEHNLVRREDGSARFSMLETIREYARERLAATDTEEEARGRHAEFFFGLGERAAPELAGPEQSLWLDRLEADDDNLRAALDWFATRRGDDRELRLAYLLWRYWRVRGHLAEGRARLEEAVARPRDGDHASARGDALYAAGCLADAQGDNNAAETLVGRSLALARKLGRTSLIAASLNVLGSLAVDEGDYERAFELLEECSGLFRRLDDTRNVAVSLQSLGRAAVGAGDHERATRVYEESAALFRQVGDVRGSAVASLNAGDLALNQGDYDTAESRCRESLSGFRQLGDQWGEAISLVNLGFVALSVGRKREARPYLEDSLRLARELGAAQLSALALEGLAALAAEEENGEQAARLLGAAEAQLGATEGAQPFERALRERTLTAAHESLGDEMMERALAEGREAGLERVVAEALEVTAGA